MKGEPSRDGEDHDSFITLSNEGSPMVAAMQQTQTSSPFGAMAGPLAHGAASQKDSIPYDDCLLSPLLASSSSAPTRNVLADGDLSHRH